MAALRKFLTTAREQGLYMALSKTFAVLARARRLRRSIPIMHIQPGDGAKLHPLYEPWKHVIPLPPPSLMYSIGAPNVANFYVVADAWAQVLGQYLLPDSNVMDVGSGCGRTARLLAGHPYIAAYSGFDVITENVAWCRNFITPRTNGRFQFQHFDVYSDEYNPRGVIQPDQLRFPAQTQSIALVFAASVFTHLLEKDARHYLREVARVLEPDKGRALLSIHIVPQAGLKFSGTERRIDVDPDYFIELTLEAGLELVERIGNICGQEAFCFKPRWSNR